MEVAVIQDDASSLSHICSPDSQIIVKHQSKLRIANQVAFHLNDAVDGRVDNHAISVE